MQQTTRRRARARPPKPTTMPREPGDRTSAGRTRLRAGTMLFDRYRLERELGRGGVAEVWRAHDERLNRSVAIKILHPELLRDAGWRRRFVQEARAASSLAHPGIVPVYDVVDDPKTPAIVFQLVDGESLATRLQRDGRLDVDEGRHVAMQVAEALEHAHRAGLVHRDVKPANIVIDRDGRARLVDFGIARLVEEADAEREGREVVGTLRYMAPEQLAGRSADARTDLYALGLVIAEMLPDLEAGPGWLRELVDRLRSTDPADRPASAGDVARAFESGPAISVPALAPDVSATGAAAAARPTVTPADVDPDAVTRAFGEPTARDEVDEAEVAGVPAAAAATGPAPLPDPSPAPAAAPVAAAVESRSPIPPQGRTDHRPVVAALLVTGLLLAGFAVERGDLFGAPAGGSPTSAPAVIATQAPTPIPPAPKPQNGHGHGHGHGG